MDDVEFIEELATFLLRSDVERIFLTHPNHIAHSAFTPDLAWLSWWDWAAEAPQEQETEADTHEPKWLQLWRYYVAPGSALEHEADISPSIPSQLKSLVDTARRLQLPRQQRPSESGHTRPDTDSEQKVRGPTQYAPENGSSKLEHHRLTAGRIHGMSPKKAHEVQCMTAYISELLSSSSRLRAVRHAVDIGAGQAYLSRSLRDKFGLHVLALDWSEVQSQGAARKESRNLRAKVTNHSNDNDRPRPTEKTNSHGVSGSLEYKTLSITTDTLLAATDDWMRDASQSGRGADVVMLALHACGSLTPDIFRAFVAQQRDTTYNAGEWKAAAAVVVGCCYNLLRPQDSVLRQSDARKCPSASRTVKLTSNHLQLAAQTPGQWGRSTAALAETKLAIRKVAWRAMLEGILAPDLRAPESSGAEGSHASGRRRLGKLNDAAYANWEGFLARASEKIGVDLVRSGESCNTLTSGRDRAMESRLEVFHVLRCILGPVVESFILLDRELWLQEQLPGMDVQLVNLFDQASGSGRNVAIVVQPSDLR